jgi:hypothetical protein
MKGWIMPSSFEQLKEHEEMLKGFAKGLAELYDINRDGDEYWTAVKLPNDLYADINVWIWEKDGQEKLKISAYAVDPKGYRENDQWLSLYEQPLEKKHTKREGKIK